MVCANLIFYNRRNPSISFKEKQKYSLREVYKNCKSIKLKYGFNHRYHESVEKASDIIKSKKFGDIVNIRGVYGKSKIVNIEKGWRSERKLAGGGILLDQGIHMLDMISLFVGNIVEIKSMISNSFWNKDVEDNAFALLRSIDGKIISIHSSATQWQHKFLLEITLDKALIILSGILSGSKSYGKEKLILIKRTQDDKGSQKQKKYSVTARKVNNFLFGGRLANYAYYDMDMTILAALTLFKKIKKITT